MTTPESPPLDGGGAPQADLDTRPIAAFDFDGTLTVTDSFAGFLRGRTSGVRWLLGLLRLAPAATRFLVTRDRGRLKAASVRVFLRGVPRARLAQEAETFAACNAARLFRPDALACWATHRAAGDRLAIVTASPEEVVAPFAARLGADALIGSRLKWTEQDRVGAGLDGPNCRGPEKVRRLQARFGVGVEVADAYGDTSGDREMLALAERGHMRLFTGRPARTAPLSRASASPSRRHGPHA